MSFQKSKLLVLLALAATITANPFNGCISVAEGLCTQCLERYLNPDGSGCGPLRPPSDRCLYYTYNPKTKTQQCNACKTGYPDRVVVNGPNYTTSCVLRTIPNCLLQLDVILDNKISSSECVACPDNTYSIFNQATRTSRCQNIPNPVPNCFWGSSADATRSTCARCNDGYAIDVASNTCQPTVEAGCWIQKSGKCVACNPFEGFSIDANGSCFKTTAALGGAGEASLKVLDKSFSRLGFGRF